MRKEFAERVKCRCSNIGKVDFLGIAGSTSFRTFANSESITENFILSYPLLYFSICFLYRICLFLHFRTVNLRNIFGNSKGNFEMITKYGVDNFCIMVIVGLILIALIPLIGKDWAAWILSPIGVILIAFAVWFFRDPQRITPEKWLEDPALIVAPCDGKVLQIIDADENEFMGGKVKQISIFLSPLDVHVNRIPLSGTVKY